MHTGLENCFFDANLFRGDWFPSFLPVVFANKILFALQVYMPTSFDKSFGQQEVNKHLVHFSFWDTSGTTATTKNFC